MFTGIISSMGTIAALERSDAGAHIIMRVDFDLSDVALGASISHAGCCLTVVSKTANTYRLDVSNETLNRFTAALEAATERLGGGKVGLDSNRVRAAVREHREAAQRYVELHCVMAASQPGYLQPATSRKESSRFGLLQHFPQGRKRRGIPCEQIFGEPPVAQ